MSIVSLDNPIQEQFNFSNGIYLIMDYCIKDDKFKDPLIPGFARWDATLRRSILYDNNKIMSEVIEDNPDYISPEEELKLNEMGIIKGDEFEKVVNFPDGKVAKIEYWITPEKRDENFGRYAANYRRSVLFDENGEIISEIMEHNPNFRHSGNMMVEDSYDYDDEFLD